MLSNQDVFWAITFGPYKYAFLKFSIWPSRIWKVLYAMLCKKWLFYALLWVNLTCPYSCQFDRQTHVLRTCWATSNYVYNILLIRSPNFSRTTNSSLIPCSWSAGVDSDLSDVLREFPPQTCKHALVQERALLFIYYSIQTVNIVLITVGQTLLLAIKIIHLLLKIFGL